MNSSVDKLCMKRMVGGRGLISMEECVKPEELGLSNFVAGSKEWMLKVAGTCMEAGSERKMDMKKRMAEEWRERLIDEKLHGKFFRETKNGPGDG